LIFGFATFDRDEREKDQVRDMEELGDFEDSIFWFVRMIRIANPTDNGAA